MGRLLIILGFLGLLAVAIAFGFVERQLEPMAKIPKESQIFVVDPGTSLAKITRNLKTAGLIRNAKATEWLGRYRGAAGRLRTGEYAIAPHWTPDAILTHLSSGPVHTYEVVLPEGLHAIEIANRLEAAGLVNAEDFLKVARDPLTVDALGLEGNSLEGYLFPETYRMPRNLPPERVAQVLIRQFNDTWKSIEAKAKERKMSMIEVVTLASIIEKETAAPEERPLIASVFHNRMRKGMRLETDPTVIYGIPDFDGNLRRHHLEDPKNPYNTYKHKGLPPGPIANPGAEALRAAVEPAESEYLFFVSRNDGTHAFSRTYSEHEKLVDRYQRRPRRP
jgi:UPF0755 protein